MQTLPYTLNNRKIHYMDIKEDLQELINAQLSNWNIFVIADDANLPILEPFAEACIEKGVIYMCASGKACYEIDDLFDWNIVMREIEGRPLPSWYQNDDDVLMTSWHHDWQEGYWFTTCVASYEELLIDTVLVANLTPDDWYPRILEITEKIHGGWLPPDEEEES